MAFASFAVTLLKLKAIVTLRYKVRWRYQSASILITSSYFHTLVLEVIFSKETEVDFCRN